MTWIRKCQKSRFEIKGVNAVDLDVAAKMTRVRDE